MFLKLKGAHTYFNYINIPLITKNMHLSFKRLVVTNVPGLHASLIDFHHNTSLRFILEDDSISSTSKTCIRSCSSKGAGLWLVIMPCICSFYIAHFTFILMLCFHIGLIQPLASSLFTCECGHGLDAFGTHLVHCPFQGQRITTHDAIRNIMYAFVRKSGHIV